MRSMTGYAQIGGEAYTIEMAGVNSRFLDLKFSIPDELNSLEIEMRKLVQARINRGKIQINISKNELGYFDKINYEKFDENIKGIRNLESKYDLNLQFSLGDLIYFLKTISGNMELEGEIQEKFLGDFGECLEKMLRSKEKEAENLKICLEEYINNIDERLSLIDREKEHFVEEAREKIKKNMELLLDAPDGIDENRLLAESALIADKAEITEEVTRLKSHVMQFRGLLQKDEPVGKKLKFLTQELLREANTINYKTGKLSIINAVLDIKMEIEKIREQVENIE